MTPAARVQSAIDLLDEIIVSARDGGPAADILASRFFKVRRYAGSKDRRAVRELAWRAIRRFGDRPESGRAAMIGLAQDDPELAALFDGQGHGPEPIGDSEERSKGAAIPGWLAHKFPDCIDNREIVALLDRAPLDLRVNLLKASREDVIAAFEGATTPEHPAAALSLPTGSDVRDSEAFATGKVEIQDIGSQLICEACEAAPGMTVLDLCAGAGGKSLALAAAMNNAGRIVASDTDRRRLGQLPGRADRAGASNMESRLLDPGKEVATLADLVGKCDVVLVDAPCSGSGTWRRNPETRWRLNEKRLARVIALQAELLRLGARMVAPGGRLVYAVCSMIESEGPKQLAGFLSKHSEWTARPKRDGPGRAYQGGTLLTPAHDGCDGFYFAGLDKPC